MSLCQSNLVVPLSELRPSVRVRDQEMGAIVSVLSLTPQLCTRRRQGMDTVRRFCVTLGMLAVLTGSMGLTPGGSSNPTYGRHRPGHHPAVRTALGGR